MDSKSVLIHTIDNWEVASIKECETQKQLKHVFCLCPLRSLPLVYL